MPRRSDRATSCSTPATFVINMMQAWQGRLWRIASRWHHQSCLRVLSFRTYAMHERASCQSGPIAPSLRRMHRHKHRTGIGQATRRPVATDRLQADCHALSHQRPSSRRSSASSTTPTGASARYIRAKQKLITLLEEQKQAIIHQRRHSRSRSECRLKPSGVEWLGDVPEHWEVTALKCLVRQIEPSDHAQCDCAVERVHCWSYCKSEMRQSRAL